MTDAPSLKEHSNYFEGGRFFKRAWPALLVFYENMTLMLIIHRKYLIQSNLFNTDTKGTEPSVRFIQRCPYYRGRECMVSVFLGPKQLSVIEMCPYYRGVHKERFDCSQ